MAATSQPISIVPQARSQSSADGSQMHSRPIFVSGSFGNSYGSKLFPGCSPAGQLLNPLDPSDFKCRVSSSIESDHGSLINNQMSEREVEQCRNFSCCGLPLNDLHALVEHFETHHVFVVDPSLSSNFGHVAAPSASGVPARSTDSSLAGALGQSMPANGDDRRRQSSLSLSMTGCVAAFDPDDMELDMEADSPPSSSSSQSSPEAAGVALPGSGPHLYNPNGTFSSVSSPPDTPLLNTPVSPVQTVSFANGGQTAFPWTADGSFATPTSTVPAGPSAFDSVHLPAKNVSMFTHPYACGQSMRRMPHHFASMYALRTGAQSQSHAALVASAMNGYAGYSDYSSGFPGTIASGSSNAHMGGLHSGVGEVQCPTSGSAIHPSLLFGGSSNGFGRASSTPAHAPSRGRMEVNSPMTTPAPSRASSPSSNVNASSSTGKARFGSSGASVLCTPSTTLSRPASSLLLSKPFKCPKPGCMKSYKQANGLKYHVTHGQCNFTPPPELSSVEGLSEREAERRLRPFCCQVPPCQRRYKNMNGLRYHYQHSGDHGAKGLALLASGNHDATKSQPSPPSISLDTDVPPAGSSASASAAAPNEGGCEGAMGMSPAHAMSAPPTPAPGRQFASQFSVQSQPASAYASPWGSPRSGSPYQQQGAQQQLQSSQPMPVPVPRMAYPQAQWAVPSGGIDAMIS